MKRIFILSVLFFMFYQTALSQDKNTLNGEKSYAFELFGVLNDSTSNIVFSPFSIRSAFSILYAGAASSTKNEISNFFGFPENKKAFLQSYSFSNSGKISNDYVFKSTNSVWADNDLALLDTFSLNCENYLSAKVYRTDFLKNAEQSRLNINKDVLEKTENRIVDFLPPKAVDSRTRCVLVNAVYFKAQWKNPFSKESCTEASFFSNKDTIEMKFMNGEGEYFVSDGDFYTAVSLPYSSEPVEMVLILPQNEQSIDAFINERLAKSFGKIISESKKQKIRLSVPKFKIESNFEFSKTLSEKLPLTLSGAPDFSALSTEVGLSISKIFHSGFIEVNEQGTEASAATAVVVSRSLGGNMRRIVFNRPFIYLVRNKETNEILFLGVLRTNN